MCGIAGLINTSGWQYDILEDVCQRMTGELVHRGPDDAGRWADASAGIALGHRRLSILDLSPEGHQPMVSASGRYVVVYNGEVYNYSQIRRELELEGKAPVFRGHSDTEVILAAISAWGLMKAVGKFVGMFAIALWDEAERVLFLVRDRMGIKPLYYGWAGADFVFGSELKALRAHPNFSREIDNGALKLYFRHHYIPAPHCIYKNTFKLRPGHMLAVPTDPRPEPQRLATASRPYWSATETLLRESHNRWSGSDVEAVDALESLLRDAVELRMISDVPLGAFLSGGIDSSTVVAMMQDLSSMPVKTYSIGFYEESFNEAKHASDVAAYLGTDHTELYLTDEEAMAIVPNLPMIYDEPFADSSQIPTFLVSKLASESVTVSLSGDGGDELFCGYSRYLSAKRLWEQVRRIPQGLRLGAASIIKATPSWAFDFISWPFEACKLLTPFAHGMHEDSLRRYADYISARSYIDFYLTNVSYIRSSSEPMVMCREPEPESFTFNEICGSVDYYQLMSLLDMITYLPDDILVKLDRASMAVGLEARVPILDHRVVEFAARIPSTLKVRDGKGKWLLRQVLARYVPEKLTDRPKMGFGVPIGNWLRGSLKHWAEDLLDETTISCQGFLIPSSVRPMWVQHLSGKRDWAANLWAVLMFQCWLQQQ